MNRFLRGFMLGLNTSSSVVFSVAWNAMGGLCSFSRNHEFLPWQICLAGKVRSHTPHKFSWSSLGECHNLMEILLIFHFLRLCYPFSNSTLHSQYFQFRQVVKHIFRQTCYPVEVKIPVEKKKVVKYGSLKIVKELKSLFVATVGEW